MNGTQEKIDAAGRFEASWGNEQTFMPGHYPIYYEWAFRTGDDDVETLAGKIKPQELKGLDVGKLWMNVEDIGYGKNLEYHGRLDPANPDRQGVMPFEGALRMVGPETPTMVQRPGADEKTWVGNLAALLNLGTQYRTTSLATLSGFTQNVIWQEQDDPLLVPPIYGRWYAQQDGSHTLKPAQQGNWLEQLNLDPAYRAAAGLGAEVVRQHQDEFVGRAWEQFSMPRRNLNIELLRLRFAQEVTRATYAKHFAIPATPTEAAINRQIALTNTLHSVVMLDGGQR
ncbi:hypothetical protein HMF3257_32760 [Spirosoma telluris]|uniref:Uncharacterized protein n=1 Tax=Spirosoma telluris TaxID=2183553 RepID=A0A327NQR5_9BACT|nr:hypothetical protein HMF3257_32760 [Spirosoma telluris]